MIINEIINKIENEGLNKTNTNRIINFYFGNTKDNKLALFIKNEGVFNIIPLSINSNDLSALYWNLYTNIKSRYNNNSRDIAVSIYEKTNLANLDNPSILIEFAIHSNLINLKLDNNQGYEKEVILAIKNDFLNLVKEKKASK